jgi:hypothetical protein
MGMTNILVDQVTGAAAVAHTLAPDQNFVLLYMKVHLSAAGGAVEDLTITVDANAGTAYDAVIMTQAMNAIVDLVYQPNFPIFFERGDELDIAWANTNTRTYGIELGYRLEV